MIYTKEQIIKDVRKVLDENTTAIELTELSDNETLDLDAIIIATLTDAAQAVESAAPLHLLDYSKELTSTAEVVDGRVAYVELPHDFMRMVAVRWSQLARPIYKFISIDSPEYAVQQNEYVQGTIERPVAAIVVKKNTHILEIYADGIVDNTEAYIGDYIPLPVFSGNNIELCSRCYRAIIYRCAGMVCAIYKDANSEILMKISESILV